MTHIKRVEKYRDWTNTIYELPNGNRHKEDGPSFIREYNDGNNTNIWYYDNDWHRYGGPAVTLENGNLLYYVHGSHVTDIVNKWLSERDYVWDTMGDIEKWELEVFMRSLG